MASWEELLVKKGYDGTSYLDRLCNFNPLLNIGWESRMWHPNGIGALNTRHFFEPEGFRRFQLGLDLEIYKHYVPTEGGEEVYKQALKEVNQRVRDYKEDVGTPVQKGFSRIVFARSLSAMSPLWPALLLTKGQADGLQRPCDLKVPASGLVGVKLLCWQGKQEVGCLVKPDQCVRVSEQDLCDILERYLDPIKRKRIRKGKRLNPANLEHFVAGIAWALALGAREDGSSLVPVLDPVSNWGVQALSPTLLADPWGSYSNEDIAAALPTLQGESLRAVSEALRKLRPREEQQEPPSATSGGTSQASAGGGRSVGGEDSNPRPLKRAKEQGQPDTGVQESKQGGAEERGQGRGGQARAQREEEMLQQQQEEEEEEEEGGENGDDEDEEEGEEEEEKEEGGEEGREEEQEQQQVEGREEGREEEEGRQSLDERVQALIEALKALNDTLAQALNKEAPAVSPHLQAAVTFLETMQRGGFEIRDPSWIKDADVTVAYALKVTVGELTSLSEQRKKSLDALCKTLHEALQRHEALLAGLWTPASHHLNSKGVRQRLTDLEAHLRNTETRLQSEKAALGKLEGLLPTLTDDNPAKVSLKQTISKQRQQVEAVTLKLQQLRQEQTALQKVNEAIIPWTRARVGRDEAVARLKSAKIVKGNVEQQWAGLRRALRRRTSVAQQGESSP